MLFETERLKQKAVEFKSLGCGRCGLPVALWARWRAAMKLSKAIVDEGLCTATGPHTILSCHAELHRLIGGRLMPLARKALGRTR